MSQLNTCGCCKGISPETPMQLSNRPGLNAIAYRVGTYSEFRETLLSALSNNRLPALRGLSTRTNDDFSIALLDAWSVVCDVLTFYQERIANESYLRTASERFSILQIARLIGYELRPGVAAVTYLAFTLDKTAGTVLPISIATSETTADSSLTSSITINTGIKVQSIPGPDEQPQTYETIEDFEARPEWNQIKPRILYPQTGTTDDTLIFKGITNDLKRGDILLILSSSNPQLKKIVNLTIDSKSETTRVDTLNQPSWPPPVSGTDAVPGSYADIKKLLPGSVLNDAVASAIVDDAWKEEDLSVLLEMKKWSINDLLKSVKKELNNRNSTADKIVFIFRKIAYPFGYNAPKKIKYKKGKPVSPLKWVELDHAEQCGRIYLDNEYKEILADSYIGVNRQNSPLANANIFKITKADTTSRSEYGLSGKTTLLEIPAADSNCWFDSTNKKLSAIREITIFAQNEKLELAYLANEKPVEGNVITLDRWYPGLKKGKKIILTGERTDLKGTVASEVLTLQKVYVQNGYTIVQFEKSLVNHYIRASVVINANVAFATHGETVKETLGSGDSGKAFQKFILKQPPLTYTSASSATGAESTLKIYVNDILWHQVDSFFDHNADERIYITRMDDDGTTTVIFGDGITGLRLPSGTENVRAVYRKGTGLGGLVKEKQLSQLLTKPLGVREAINAIASNGAADAERLDEARNNASLTLLTMGRVVSLQDYEDFARAFSGIEKALANWTWKEHKRWIYLTVAGANGALVEDELSQKLLAAIRKFGDSRVNVIVESYQPLFFRITANIKIEDDYLPEKILPEIEKKLRAAFSFRERTFGQPVAVSEVTAVCQKVKGVVAVDIDDLHYSDEGRPPAKLLKAFTPVTGEDGVKAAELLTLDPGPLSINNIL
jgi:hypothetical protein